MIFFFICLFLFRMDGWMHCVELIDWLIRFGLILIDLFWLISRNTCSFSLITYLISFSHCKNQMSNQNNNNIFLLSIIFSSCVCVFCIACFAMFLYFLRLTEILFTIEQTKMFFQLSFSLSLVVDFVFLHSKSSYK